VHDVIVIGGGPAGSTAAFRAAAHGLDVMLLEQTTHPRFHVGESLLPRNISLIRDLGLADKLREVPQVHKLGASFAFGNETGTSDFRFKDGLLDRSYDALNVERAGFDTALLEAAREAGATIEENVTVRRVARLGKDGCSLEVRTADGRSTLREARLLIDASGQSTVVGRHLKTRRSLPDLRNVAYFNHFEGVPRFEGDRGGHPLVVMCREGWFWFIPIDEVRTSIGLIAEPSLAERAGVPAKQMLEWAIHHCPRTREMLSDVEIPRTNRVAADFSYTCRPYAGPGFFLVGDAATFVDPVFSTGVCLGMMSAALAADAAKAILRDGQNASHLVRNYRRYVLRSSSVLFRMVRAYYTHSFREVFLHGMGPFEIHRAVISILAGHVFPKPPFEVVWRLWMFEFFIRLQKYFTIVPRRPGCSLLDGRAG
jgi:flavin-dependent dehydrogenase